MDLIPEEIRNKQFKTRWVSGYDMDEVEAFLNTTAGALQTVYEENEALRNQLSEIKEELAEFSRKRKLLEDVLVSAQRVIHDMKANAVKEAENILKEAENQADRWLADANSQLFETKRELRDITTLRRDYELRFKHLLESHQEQFNAMQSLSKEEEGEEQEEAIDETL